MSKDHQIPRSLLRRRTGEPLGIRPDDSEPARPEPRRIVLTGGPGGGKSTAASFLAREFPRDIWVLPEAATMLYKGGMPRGESQYGINVAQRAIFDLQRALERAHGVQHPDRVQVCDRGTVDGAAYWPEGPEAFFTAMGTSPERELRRYDAVIFLHTSAFLPAGYERDMETRTEANDEACALDSRVFDLYRSHPRLITIRSTGSFLAKLAAVTDAVRSFLDHTPTPHPDAFRKRFRELEHGPRETYAQRPADGYLVHPGA